MQYNVERPTYLSLRKKPSLRFFNTNLFERIFGHFSHKAAGYFIPEQAVPVPTGHAARQ
jgi:hypothetical protein